jgi:hypothetical protein
MPAPVQTFGVSAPESVSGPPRMAQSAVIFASITTFLQRCASS